MTFDKGITDGYQSTVDNYKWTANPAYRYGCLMGRMLRKWITRGELNPRAISVNGQGEVTIKRFGE